jgi:hypothetical protein
MKRTYILILATLLLVPGALAGPILSTLSSACLGVASAGGVCVGQGGLNSSIAGTLTGANGAMTYSNSASAAYGSLHVFSQSSFDVTNDGVFAGGFARFEDVLTISNPFLNGQTGILLLGYDVDGTVAHTGISAAFLQVVARVFAPTLQNYVIDYQASTDISTIIPQQFTFTFGDPFTLYFSLQAATGTETVGGAGYSPASGTGTGTGLADFSNSFTLSRLIVQDEHGNPVSALFSSESGTTYGPNGVVPEPSTFLALGSGFLVIGVLRRRSARRES